MLIYIFLVSFFFGLHVDAMETFPDLPRSTSPIKKCVTNSDVKNWMASMPGCWSRRKFFQDGDDKPLNEVSKVASVLFDTIYEECFLRSLSLPQAINLFGNDLEKALVFNKKLDPSILFYVAKLRIMFHLDATRLANCLRHEQVREWFKNEHSLFELLLQMLPEEKINDVSKNELCDCLEMIKAGDLLFNNFKTDRDLLLEELAGIRNKTYKVFSADRIESDLVELLTIEKNISISMRKLTAVSDYFVKHHGLSFFDLRDYDSKEIAILLNIADGKVPTISDENLLLALNTGKDFNIDILTEKCDEFLENKELSREVLENFQSTNTISLFEASIKFCNAYGLNLFCKKLCKKLAHRLNDLLKGNSTPLDDLKILDGAQLYEVWLHFRGDLFRNKLMKAAFLNWIWSEIATGDECFSPLRQIVRYFCQDKDKEKQFVVAQAWVTTPAQLMRNRHNKK